MTIHAQIPNNSSSPFSSPTTLPLKLTFIGGGVLARAFIDGLLASPPVKLPSPSSISVTARRKSRASELSKLYPDITVTLSNDSQDIWSNASSSFHVVFICTKPADTWSALSQIREPLSKSKPENICIVTVCPGISVASLSSALPESVAVVRSMPNTPLSVGEGATGLFSDNATKSQLDVVVDIFRRVSPSTVVLNNEDDINVVASCAGSAPAYFYYLMELLIKNAVENGLEEEAAREVVVQSCIGAGALAKQDTKRTLQKMKDDVCVPGGSTRKAMDQLEGKDWEGAVKSAVSVSLKANRDMGRK